MSDRKIFSPVASELNSIAYSGPSSSSVMRNPGPT